MNNLDSGSFIDYVWAMNHSSIQSKHWITVDVTIFTYRRRRWTLFRDIIKSVFVFSGQKDETGWGNQ